MVFRIINTEIGALRIVAKDGFIIKVEFCEKYLPKNNKTEDEKLLDKAEKELLEYFERKRKIFTFPTKILNSTTFQNSVWNELKNIKYGTTATYGEIAKKIGNPKASRAVGTACNRNPLFIVIPCHRVIGVNGKLTGFAGGLEIKKYLLELENS